MKKLSRILAAMLVVFTLLSTVAFAADFSDVTSENKYYEPIKVLASFGIINGYEDGTFGPDKDVNRAEFSKMLMGTMASAGIGNPDPAGMPFTDMHDPAVAWAVGDIRSAYDLGIINGMTATTFEPKSNVTYEQALKMIVCALNYGGQAEALQAAAPNNPWYYGYLQTARALSLTDNVVVMEGQPAKRSHIAQLLYNALEVKTLEKVQVQGGGEMYMESDNTWLEDKLKITKERGVLLADESNTMDEDGETARTGYAMFVNKSDDEKIDIAKNGISLDGYLGKEVEYFYKTDMDGTNTLVLVLSKSGSNTSVKVDASNLSKISGSYSSGYTVSYYESATATREKKLTVSPKAIISINGEVKTDVSIDELNIETGSLEFISTGGNSYSKINVESYKTYVVKSVNKTDKYILDMYRPSPSNTLVIDDEDSDFRIYMKNTSGNEITISNLSQYNVLTVREGNSNSNRTTLDITVSTKNVSGSIKEIGDDYLNINGTEYRISRYLETYGIDDVNKLDIGDSCKAYFDNDGNIAYIAKVSSTSTYYGYVGDAGKNSNDEVRLALISQKTTTMGSPVVTLANKVRIDGELYSDPNEILEKLEEAAGVYGTNVDGNGSTYSQLIKYTVNTSGKITEIDTVLMSDEEDPTDETVLSVYEKNSGVEMTYNSSEFKADGKKFRINSSSQIILVPKDRDEFESYGRKTSSFFKTNGTAYMVEAYNVTGSLNTAEVVVVYETDATETVIDGRTSLFIITGITQTTNDEGEPCDKVTGYQISYSGTVTADKEFLTDGVGVVSGKYKIGDVIMYVTNNKGYVAGGENKLECVLDVADFTPGQSDVIVYSNTGAQMTQGLLVGAELDGSKHTFILAMTDDPEECEDAKQETFETSTKNFFVYDSEKTGDKKVAKDDSFDLTSLVSYNDTVESGTPNAAKLFVYEYDGSVRAIVIIK